MVNSGCAVLSKGLGNPKLDTHTTADNINTVMNKDLFRNGEDYWLVAQNIKDLYLSEGSILTLMDFERVLDQLDLYAFKNWSSGELVSGPEVGRYAVTCTFMWPVKLMPDPRGARRLLPFDGKIKFKKTQIKIPVKIEDPNDYIPGTHKARLITQPVWLVSITIPKSLMQDIRVGSVELEDRDIDMQDLDDAYEQDLDQDQYTDQTDAETPNQPATAV
jgi:hypothetical protein